MTVAALPPAVLTAIATLRTAAYWLPDDGREMLLDAAHRAEVNWDGGCCPICEETFCDGGCPLEDVRTGLYEGLMGDYEDPDRGLHENLLAIVDTDMPQPSHLKTALTGIVNLAADTWERPTLIEMIRNSPDLTPAGNGICYAASWGMVHSRPSCRCPR